VIVSIIVGVSLVQSYIVSDSPCKSSGPHFLLFRGYTHTTGKLCLTSIVQIAWRLYNIVSYETINEFYYSQKLSMTETVYIYNHWTTGWSFTTKNCADQKPKMVTTTRHSFIYNHIGLWIKGFFSNTTILL